MKKLLRPISLAVALALVINVLTFTVFSATKDNDSSGADIDVKATSAYTNSTSNYKTYSGNDLGATYTPASTTFKVWAPSASAVKLNLYKTGSDAEEGAGKIGSYNMTLDSSTGVWSVKQNSDLKGIYYTYSVTVNGITKETRDVYSKATGVNSARSMVVDLNSTNPDGWSNDKHVLLDSAARATVWEFSVRDFSIDASSGVDSDKRGKYLGVAQHGTTLNGAGNIKTGIDYLIENNINCVQIMPTYDFGSVDETKGGQNWGYDPMNYNVPEGSFSSDPYHGEVRIKEMKTMIKALHDAGITVIMDVVYNHTYNTSDSCFEMTVPGYYYRMNGSTFLNGSGCGNVTASDKTMYRKYMIDSVKYWANEYHIDGFRFDLMGCHDVTTMNNIRAELDKIDKRIITYGEPWMADWGGGNGIANSSAAIKDNASKLDARVGCFDDVSRSALKGDVNDASKGFIQGSTANDWGVKAGTMGNISSMWGNTYKAPTQVLHYLSCHDNLTLWDKILKSNSSTDYNGTNSTYLAMNKLAAAFTFTSQGISFTQAGEEFARTKSGAHNSYNAGDAVNKIDWTRVSKYSNLVNYYKGLRTIRQVYTPFADGTTTSVGASYIVDSPAGVVAYTMQNKTANASKEWGTTAVILNANSSAKSVTLKSSGALPSQWATIVNGTSAGLKNLGTVSGNTISVPARSAMVLVDLASFNSKNIQEPTKPITTEPANSTIVWNTTKIKGFADGSKTEKIDGKVTHINKTVEPEDGYTIVRAQVITGGKDITATAFNSATNTLNFDTNGDTTILLYASQIHKYGDVNNDDYVDVSDATAIQKRCAGIATFDSVAEKAADVNNDKVVNVSDATMIQKKLAGIIPAFPAGETFQTGEEPSTPSTSSTIATDTQPSSQESSSETSVGGDTINFVSKINTGEERWAAYFWNSAGLEAWADVVNGTVTVPSGAENVIFVRFKGTSTENKWDPEGTAEADKNVWNQTEDLTIDGTTYTVTDWGNGWGAKLVGAWS